jgi:hypothetical protein
MYRSPCYGPRGRPITDRHGFHGIWCLSVVGWLFTIVFTYLGFACLIVGKLSDDKRCTHFPFSNPPLTNAIAARAGTFWGANLHVKIAKAWRDLRKSHRHP